MKLVVATHNRKKGVEMHTILQSKFPDVEILTLDDFPEAPEPEETGTTYAENATIKAESARDFTGLPCIADDAGLEVDALDGAPGLHSKRFAGEETPFTEKIQILLDKIAQIGEEGRGARFRCCIAFAVPGQPTHVIEDTCEGTIALEPVGTGGFGYDPIFFLPELGCTMAELTPEQKHAISHRGKVLRRFAEWLAQQ